MHTVNAELDQACELSKVQVFHKILALTTEVKAIVRVGNQIAGILGDALLLKPSVRLPDVDYERRIAQSWRARTAIPRSVVQAQGSLELSRVIDGTVDELHSGVIDLVDQKIKAAISRCIISAQLIL